ncbi:acetate--CoA ligase family protein [Candidatus Woesearchaeota archaeon]|nr:acetate--CoA ligase family protein [Candidatus Woesearchaeota archaeon]
MAKEVLGGLEAINKVKNFIPVANSILTTDYAEAIDFIKNKYPVVLKLISPEIVHKTEIGGILTAHTNEEVRNIFKQFISSKYKLTGVLVQEYVEGREFFLGIKNDNTFSHVLGFGIGGVLVELYKDVNWRVCPINKKDAFELIEELKGKALLAEFRGLKPVNKKILANYLINLSKLPFKYPEVKELDINPFIMSEKKGKAVDVRIVVS